MVYIQLFNDLSANPSKYLSPELSTGRRLKSPPQDNFFYLYVLMCHLISKLAGGIFLR